MKPKTNILFIILLVGTLTLVSADSIGSFQLGVDNVQIYQTCNNCTSLNFTRVMSPNNQTILTNLTGVQDGTYYYFDILKGNFTKNGEHRYCYVASNPITSKTGCLTFDISYTGQQLTEQTATTYVLSIGVLIFFLIGIILLISKLPTRDATDEEGTILQISNLKHLRPVLWGISWGIILAILFIVGNVTLAYLPTTMVGDMFMRIFFIMFALTIPGLFLWLIWIFTGIFRDREFKQMIERGVDIKSTP